MNGKLQQERMMIRNVEQTKSDTAMSMIDLDIEVAGIITTK